MVIIGLTYYSYTRVYTDLQRVLWQELGSINIYEKSRKVNLYVLTNKAAMDVTLCF